MDSSIPAEALALEQRMERCLFLIQKRLVFTHENFDYFNIHKVKLKSSKLLSSS